jgi:transcriptional regulator with GAF, ATPase, and Fis domain
MINRTALQTWREVSRFLELDESLPRIVSDLQAPLAIEGIGLYRLDDGGRACRLIGHGGTRRAQLNARVVLDPEARAALDAWAARGTVGPGEASTMLVRRMALGGGEVLIGPLREDGGLVGLAALQLRERRRGREPDFTAFDLLLEPLTVALLNDERMSALSRRSEAVAAENRALLSRLERTALDEDIVGASEGLRDVMARVEQVAPTDAPVLILGETGSGKEVIARAVHARSGRHNGPLLRVNCGAIAPELVDSELFGHEKGSFTGAHEARRGWFERADGGTLFLDEIGELSPAAQVRLLRVLQDGTLERVGGSHTVTVDVRIVAATHRDLHSMVAARSFREDLWYRLSVFPIRLPPLRERPHDIPALAAHFAARAGKRLGGLALAPSAEDVRILAHYSWPGNVRELSAVIERAAILGDGKSLEISAALGMSRAEEDETQERRTPGGSTLDDAVRVAIEAALTSCHGRVEGPRGAAKRLGINAATLRSRMRKLGMDWGRYRD